MGYNNVNIPNNNTLTIFVSVTTFYYCGLRNQKKKIPKIMGNLIWNQKNWKRTKKNQKDPVW